MSDSGRIRLSIDSCRDSARSTLDHRLMTEHLRSRSSAPTLPIGALGYAVPLVCFLIAMVDGYDTLMLSFIAPLIATEWALTPAAVGALFASTYAGAALGATAIGTAADRFGRKALLVVSLVV